MLSTKWLPPRFLALLALSVLSHSQARAEDIAVESERVTLAMILPALEGTELGALDVAPAPLPGESSVIRSSDVKAKLRESGRDARGLAIPKSVRIVRQAKKLEQRDLDELVKTALAPRVAPCDIEQLSTLPALTVAAGDFELDAEPLARKQSGRTNVTIKLTQGDRVQRISAQAVLSCPEPVVMPGASIRLVVNAGAVHVSAPGVANQPGRVGDEIRVTNQLTKKGLRGRVLDAQSVEVIQ
jgi:hypothetical protein